MPEKYIKSYELIMPLLLDNYCRADYNEQQAMLKGIFIPIGKMIDKVDNVIKEEKDNDS